MKKSKLILLAIISLIVIAILYEGYLLLASNTEVKITTIPDVDSVTNLNDSISIHNKKIKDILGTEFSLTLGIGTKGKIKYTNKYSEHSTFHINDIEVYLNEPANYAIFICRDKEKEAFYHIKQISGGYGDGVYEGTYDGTSEKYSPSKTERCFSQREQTFNCVTQIRGEDLPKIIEILNWYKVRLYNSPTNKLLIKPVPSNYIDSKGVFIDQEPHNDPIAEEKKKIDQETKRAEQEEKDKYYEGGAPERFKKAKKFSF